MEYRVMVTATLEVAVYVEAESPEQARDIAVQWGPSDAVASISHYYEAYSGEGNGKLVNLSSPRTCVWELVDCLDVGTSEEVEELDEEVEATT